MIPAAVLLFLVAAAGDPADATASRDLKAARAVFEKNLAAIRNKDREAYLSCYLKSPDLARTGLRGRRGRLRIAGGGNGPRRMAGHLRGPGPEARSRPPRPRLRHLPGAGLRGCEGEPGDLGAAVPRDYRGVEDRRDHGVRRPARNAAAPASPGGRDPRGRSRRARRARRGRAPARWPDRLRGNARAVPRAGRSRGPGRVGPVAEPGSRGCPRPLFPDGLGRRSPRQPRSARALSVRRDRRTACATIPSGTSAPTCARV